MHPPFKYVLLTTFLVFGLKLHADDKTDSVSRSDRLPSVATLFSDTAKINQVLRHSSEIIRYNTDSALAIHQAILFQSKAIGFKKGIVESLINIAKINRIKGSFINSFTNLQDALSFCEETDYSLLLNAYVNIAINHMIQAEFKEATTYYYKAVKVAGKLKDPPPKIGRLYLNLSMLWHILDNERMEVYYLQKAEQEAIKNKDTTCLTNVYSIKGDYFMKNDTAKALNYYYKCLSISRQAKDKYMEASSIGSIAYVHILKKNLNTANLYLKEFKILSENANLDVYHRLGMTYSYGLYALLLENDKEAEASWLKVIRKADSLNGHIYKLPPLSGLPELYAKRNQYAKAHHYQKLYNELKDTIVSEEKIKMINLTEHKYRLAQKDKILAQKKLQMIKQQAIVRQKNTWIILSGSGSVLLLFLLFSLHKSNKRKRQLHLEKLTLLTKERKLNQLKAAMAGEESERKRIAQELHDGVGSLLSVAKMNLSMIQVTDKAIQEDGEWNEAIHLLDATARELRSTAHNLMPEMVLQGGIEEALQLTCQKISMAHQVDINFQSYGNIPLLDPDLEFSFYRILRELIDQVIIHTCSDSILLQLNWQDCVLNVTIDANGRPILIDAFNNDQRRKWDQLNLYINVYKGKLEIDNADSFSGSTLDLEFDLL